MLEQAKIEHRRVSMAGIRMFRDNWFYHHELMNQHRGEMVEVKYNVTNFDKVFVKFADNKEVEAKLKKVTSMKSKSLEHSDTHLRKIIELYEYTLESIADAEISLDAGIPMKEIAKEALAQGKQISLLHNQKIEKGYGGT